MKAANAKTWKEFVHHHEINDDNNWLSSAIEMHRKMPGVKFSSKQHSVPGLIQTALESRKTELHKETVFADSKTTHVQSKGMNVHFIHGDVLQKLGHTMAKLKNPGSVFCEIMMKHCVRSCA